MPVSFLAILSRTPCEVAWFASSHSSHARAEAKKTVGRRSPTRLRLAEPLRVSRRSASARNSGGGEAQVLGRGVERDAKLTGVAAYLREEEAALDAGHRGGGKFVGVGVRPELAWPLSAASAGDRQASPT